MAMDQHTSKDQENESETNSGCTEPSRDQSASDQASADQASSTAESTPKATDPSEAGAAPVTGDHSDAGDDPATSDPPDANAPQDANHTQEGTNDTGEPEKEPGPDKMSEGPSLCPPDADQEEAKNDHHQQTFKWEQDYAEKIDQKNVFNIKVTQPSQSPSFGDPTQPFDRQTVHQKPVYRHIAETAKSKASVLRDDGLLVIVCAHEKLLETASINMVIHSDIFNQYKHRIVDLGRSEDIQALEILLNENALPCIGESSPGRGDGGQKTIVIIDIDETSGMIYFEKYIRLFSRNRFWKKFNLHYLFRISGQALVMSHQEQHVWYNLPRWEIEAWSALIQGVATDQDEASKQEADAVIEALRNGSNSGMWPDDDLELLRDVESFLSLDSNSLENLKKEIERRQAKPHQISEDAFQIFRDANIVERAALFAAVYFSECPVHQFDQILKIILVDETVEFVTEEEKINQQTGVKYTEKNVQEMTGNDWWQKFQEKSMKRLGLEFSRYRENRTVIRFTHPAMRNGFEKELHPRVTIYFFEKLYRIGLVFDPNTSKFIVDALSELTAVMSEYYMDEYNDKWLMNRLGEAMKQLDDFAHRAGIEILSHTAIDLDDLGSALRLIIDVWKPYDEILFHRLGLICREFLGKNKTAHITHAFIRQLIQRTQPNCIMALRLINQLRISLGFKQSFELLRHLLEVGNTEICQKVVMMLLEEMKQTPESYWSVLLSICQWHPSRAVESGKQISSSQHWSLGFLYLLFDQQRQLTPKEFEAQKPFMISDIALEGVPSYEERMENIAKWLTHPYLKESIQTIIRKINPDMYADILLLSGDISLSDFCIAQMLEFWNYEFGEANLAPLARPLTRYLSRKSLTDIRRIMRKFSDSMVYFISKASHIDFRNKFKKRRRMAYELGNRLLEYSRESQPGNNAA